MRPRLAARAATHRVRGSAACSGPPSGLARAPLLVLLGGSGHYREALGPPSTADSPCVRASGDAFSTLMSVLRHRKQPRRAAAAAAARRSPCSLAVLPSHLARQVKASSRSLAPGASAELLELGGPVSV